MILSQCVYQSKDSPTLLLYSPKNSPELCLLPDPVFPFHCASHLHQDSCPVVTCASSPHSIHHHHSSPRLPQLRKRQPCTSNCSWKKLWLVSPPHPHHLQSVCVLTLWTLPLKHTQSLSTTQQLWYFWPDPNYHYLFLDHCKSLLCPTSSLASCSLFSRQQLEWSC